MKRPRLRQVALIYDAKLQYDVKVMEGVASYVREISNWDIYIEENALNHQRLPNLRSWKGDGIIADFDDPKIARSVTDSRIRAVGFGGGYGWYVTSSRIPYIYTNNASIGQLAANHLLERGFRHFAFYGYRRDSINGWSDERFAAFSGRIRAAGYTCECYRGPQETSTDWPAFRDSLIRWIASLPKPVGIMCAKDTRARQALDACRFAGVKVPDDVAVVGVDNDEMLCRLCAPPLTSVEQGAHRIGYEAAALLDKMMLGQKPKRLRSVIDPITVVARESTDILAVSDERVRTGLTEIAANIGGRITPTQIAERVGCARSTLELCFTTALGRTVFSEIRRVRMKRAEQLVRETNLPLKQVADRCGFRSVQHMTTVFREERGKTPGRLRRDLGP